MTTRLVRMFCASRYRESDETLTIDDLIALLVCIEMSRRAGGIGQRVWLSITECSRYLWKAHSGKSNQLFQQSLARLHQSVVEGSAEQWRFLSEHSVKANSQSKSVHLIQVDPRVMSFFPNDVSIDVIGMAQQTSNLARWLWFFYSVQQRMGDVSVQDLHAMCKAHDPLPKFRARLRKSIAELTSSTTVERPGIGERKIPAFFEQQSGITNQDKVRVVLKHPSVKDMLQLGPQTCVDAKVARLNASTTDDQHEEATSRRRVFVVTTSSTVSDGYIDFHSRLARFGNAIDGVVRMKPAKRDQDNTRHLAGAILKLIETHNPGRNDIVAIVRGGGPDEQFTMFDAQVSIDAILALRNRGVFVIAGVGHTRHAWAIDAHVDHAAPVPFAAAEYVNRLLDLANNRPTIEPKRRIFPVRAPVQRHPAVA